MLTANCQRVFCRSKVGPGSEYENVDSDEEGKKQQPLYAAVQKPSKIPRFVGSPARKKETQKAPSEVKGLQKTPSEAETTPSEAPKASRKSKDTQERQSEQETDDFEEEERKIMALEDKVSGNNLM